MPFWDGLVSRNPFSSFPTVLLSQPQYSNSGLLHEVLVYQGKGDASRAFLPGLPGCLSAPPWSRSLKTCS